DGTPRIVPTWFQWTGHDMVMPTFVAAPHVHHPSMRIKAMRANPTVAITIDTEPFPPDVLTIRGDATITEVGGVDPDYAAAAWRSLRDDAAAYLQQIDQPETLMARIAVRPAWVSLIDFSDRLPSALGGITSA